MNREVLGLWQWQYKPASHAAQLSKQVFLGATWRLETSSNSILSNFILFFDNSIIK